MELTDLRARAEGMAEGKVREELKKRVTHATVAATIQTAETLEKEIARLKALYEECILGLNKQSMQKITPFLWFNNQCEEAMKFYVSLFPNSKVVSIKRYSTGATEGPMAGMGGKVLTGVFDIDGYQMMALDGGPHFTFTPTHSISVQCKDEQEIEALHAKLREGGSDLMALGTYPWSKKYAWINDKYGLSWQLNVPHDFGSIKNRFAETKMFHGPMNGKAEEAVSFYASIFPDSKVDHIFRNPDEKTVAHADYTLFGQPFMALDGGVVHQFGTTGAVSLLVTCKDQDEIDRYWSALSSDPASEQCGWCKDKYGFSWQIVPDMSRWLNDESEGAKRALQAMLQMKKIDIATLERAFNGA